MKKLFLTITLLISSISFLNAQEVEIKDDKVLLDGTPILKYEKIIYPFAIVYQPLGISSNSQREFQRLDQSYKACCIACARQYQCDLY